MNQIKVEICGKKGAFIKPYPDHVLDLIFDLSGRKRWENKQTIFEATPSNIRILKAVEGIKFIDDGSLNQQKNLENLPSQNDKIPALKTKYKPKMAWNKLQKDTLKQSWNRKVFAHLHGMGGRKTAIMIAECGMLFLDKKITGVLISAPNDVDQQWISEEIPKHLSDQVKYKAFCWDKKPLGKFWGNPNRLEFLSANVDSFRTKNGKTVFDDFIKRHKGNVMMIVDESHEIKNMSSQRTKAIINLGQKCSYRRIATGTPIGVGLTDSWAQFYFLDWRILGHKYKTTFQNEFCVMRHKQDPVTKKKTHIKFPVADKNTKKFWDLIAPHCFRASDKEINKDRPEAKIHFVDYNLNAKSRKIYNTLTETCLGEVDDKIITTAKNGFSLSMRHQQLICGFLPDEETGKLIDISDQRLKVCEKIVKKIDGTFIIWASFRQDYKRLKEHFTNLGYKIEIFQGSKTVRAQKKKDFLNGDIDGMIVNPKSGGTGQNFQGRCVADIYYSYNDHQFAHWQSMKRIDRDGAWSQVTHYIIRCLETVNVSTINNLSAKERRKRIAFDDIRQIIAGTFNPDQHVIKSKIKIKNKVKKVSNKELELLGL